MVVTTEIVVPISVVVASKPNVEFAVVVCNLAVKFRLKGFTVKLASCVFDTDKLFSLFLLINGLVELSFAFELFIF